MAHENLKFRLDINDNIEWQPIYAAQELQTFFVIYIKFIEYLEDVTLDLGRTASYTYQLRIQNFRGPISFGLKGTPQLVNVENHKEFCLRLNIPVMAFHVNNHSEIITQCFDNKVQRKKLLEVNTTMHIPKDIYNENDPISSKYLLPFKAERDGNTAMELGRRKMGTKDKFETYDTSGLAGKPNGICNPNISIVI